MVALTDILQEGRTYSGAEINAAGLGWLVKLTNKAEIHNGMRFRKGTCRDAQPFSPRGRCRPGGIYFCRAQDAGRFFNYSTSAMVHVRTVTLPDDARVYVEKHKMKADVFVLGPRAPIATHAALLDAIVDAGAYFDSPSFFDTSLFTEDVIRRLLAHRTTDVVKSISSSWQHAELKNLPPALVRSDELLTALAAMGVLLYKMPMKKRTKAMMDAAIASRRESYAGILRYFPTTLTDAVPRSEMVPLGAPIGDVPPAERTHDLLLQVVRSPYLDSHNLAEAFDPALFTPDVYACLVCNTYGCRCGNIAIPPETYASELLHSLVHCDRKNLEQHKLGIICTSKGSVRNLASMFPASAFTQDICNTLVLKLGFPLCEIPPQFRTRALMDELIRYGKPANTLVHFDPAFLDNDALALFAASMANGVIQFIPHCGMPDAVVDSRALLLLAIEKQMWDSISSFRECAFDQAICNRLSSTEAFVLHNGVRNIPETYRTADVFVNALQFNQSINVPHDLQKEVNRRLGAPGGRGEKKAADVQRAIQKRRKRHDWATRKRT